MASIGIRSLALLLMIYSAARIEGQTPSAGPFGSLLARARVEGMDSTFDLRTSQVLGLLPNDARGDLPVNRIECIDVPAHAAWAFVVPTDRDNTILLLDAVPGELWSYRTNVAGDLIAAAHHSGPSNTITPISLDDARIWFQRQKQYWLDETNRTKCWRPLSRR